MAEKQQMPLPDDARPLKFHCTACGAAAGEPCVDGGVPEEAKPGFHGARWRCLTLPGERVLPDPSALMQFPPHPAPKPEPGPYVSLRPFFRGAVQALSAWMQGEVGEDVKGSVDLLCEGWLRERGKLEPPK